MSSLDELLEDFVWRAIEKALDETDDLDIRAGLAWITDADKKRIANAAITAMAEAAIIALGKGAGK